MTVGFEHHQETHVSSYNNDAREDFENSSSGSHLLGNPSSTSLTYPRLRHHHFPSRSHESSGSTPAGLLPRNSMLSFGSGNKHFSHRSDPSSLSGGRGPYGESETLSHQQTNRFLSLSSSASSSPSSSKLSPTSALWGESENSSVGMTATHHHQHHNHHQNDGLSESDPHPQNNFLSALNLDVNSTKNISTTYKSFSPLESIMNKSGIHMSSYKNFSQTNSSFNFPFEEMTTLQSDDNITEQSYFDNSTRDPVLAADGINSTSDSTATVRGNIYATIIPVMLFFCVLAVLVNLIIVISARWCRKPMSPTLYFSISLALADAYAAFILATGLVINSLLPYVVKYNGVPMCLSLVVEAFRQGGVLVTVSHLLALAMNHWIGIVRPLHYAATMTRRTAWIVIIFSWICPITVIFIYFSSVYGEGFQSQGCKKYDFLTKRAYRTFFASCFFAPLILMSFIYIHIFIIVRNHHTHRQRYQNTQQLKRNVKAVLTTMLVLGTYVIGWMPATLYSLIACSDCVYKPESLPNAVRYSMGFIGNFLVILKTLVDPVIYAARMSDIQMALKKMRYDILTTFCKSCAPATPPNDRGYYLNSPSARTSFYETRSVRMSSFGSRSSSRRMPNAANASLIRQANGNQMHNNQQQAHRQLSQQNGIGTNGYVPSSNENGRLLQNTNGNSGRRSCIQSTQPQPLINSKSAFEMTEINYGEGRTNNN